MAGSRSITVFFLWNKVMTIRVLCVGRVRERFFQDAAGEYMKRLSEDIRELGRRSLVSASEDGFFLSFDRLLKRLEDFPLYMADAFTVGRNPIAPRTIISIPAKQLPSYAGNAQTAAEDAYSAGGDQDVVRTFLS